jgi:hypothetical protein
MPVSKSCSQLLVRFGLPMEDTPLTFQISTRRRDAAYFSM